MAYTPTTWVNVPDPDSPGGAPALNAANLNKIESGIADAHSSIFAVQIGSNTSGTTSLINSGTLNLLGGSNITLFQDGNTIQINGASGGTGGAVGTLSAGTQTATLGQVIFADSNLLNWGLNNQTITGSVVTSGLIGTSHLETDGHPRVSNSLGSGILKGGVLSINGGDTTKFDITAGAGIIVDNATDGSSPTRTLVTWGAQTAVTDQYVTTDDDTYILINSSGTIVQTPTWPANEDWRDYIIVGWTTHPARTDIEYIATMPYMVSDTNLLLNDFLISFGSFNVSGNEYAPYTGLQIERSAGDTFEVGVNYVTSLKNPNIISTDLVQPCDLWYFYRDGAGGWVNDATTVTAINPNYYDDNSGTLAAVPAGKWTIQVISMYAQMAANDVQYGQAYYDTKDEAIAGIDDAIALNPYNYGWDTYRCWLIVKQGETDLTSADTAFVTMGKFGLQDVSIGGAAATITAANVGSAGEGIFHAKSANELQFRKLNTLANNLSISYNTAATEIRLGVVPGNIALSALGSTDVVMLTGERANYFYTSANTFANSTHSHGNPTLALTNILGTTASNSNGLTLSLSVSPGGAGDGVNIIAAGGSTANTTGTIVFSNSNGIGFGLNGATVTASHNGITTGRASNDAIGLNTAITQNGVSMTANSSGLSLNFPAFLTTAAQSGHSHGNPTLNLTNLSGTTGSNSNGFTLSLSAGNYLTTARASNDAIGLNTALTANGVAWTVNSSGLSLNVPAFLTTALQSQMTSNYMSTAERNNYFYTSNNTFANSTHSHGNPTLALTNINGTTASASNGLTISLSANAGGAGDGVNVVQMGAGGNSVGATYSASTGTVYLYGGDNITLSQNNNSITVSAAAPGGGAGMQYMSSGNVPLANTTHSSLGQNSIWFAPFRVTGGSLSASTAQFAQSFTGSITSAVTMQWAQTIRWGFYSAANSTSYNTMSTGSITMQVWASGTSSNSWAYQGTTSSSAASNLLITQFMGVRYFPVTLASNLPPGDYMFGWHLSTSSAGYASMVRTANNLVISPLAVAMASWGSQTNNSIGLGPAARFTTTSAALPATINPIVSLQVSQNVVPYIKIGALQ